MLTTDTAQELARLRATALTEHYQKTMELVTHHWERRSRQFVTLVAVLAGAAQSSFTRPLIAPTLDALILERFPNLNPMTVNKLTPLTADLLLAFLVISVFYLTASLVNRTSMITTYYGYLDRLEPEIRGALNYPPGHIVFTREGDFYRISGSNISRLIARCYKWVLGSLLVFFFSARLFFDYPAELWSLPALDRAAILAYVAKTFLFVIDVLIVIPTAWLFVRFVTLEPLRAEEIETKMKMQAGRT
jgi:hypothetical protein